MTLDPAVTGQSAALLLETDESQLSLDGRAADSVTIALARGMRFDSAARDKLCGRAQAARSACPGSSRIGFGRFVVTVRGFLFGGGEADLAWSIDAFLGQPLQRGDAASVVLTSKLLGADSIASLLAPALGARIPTAATTVGRVVRPASGAYGVELRFAQLPVQVDVPGPITAAPTGLELALSAVRRVRVDFIRHFKVKTPSGYEVRKIRDHHLIGHYLLRTPRTCASSWPSELSVGFAGVEKHTASPIACSKAATPSIS